jgi:uncharacterized RDD family membrane protein YckC
MQWYAKIRERQIGPMSEDALRAMAGSGQIGCTTLLWRPGLKEWIAADQVPGVITPPDSNTPPPSIARLPSEGERNPQRAVPASPETAETISAVPRPISMNLAVPWQRFWARLLDNLIWVTGLSFLLGMLWPSLFQDGGFFAAKGAETLLAWFLLPFAMALDAIAFTVFGNTFGKWVAGIKILTLRGERLPFQEYLKRNFGVYGFGLGTGFPLVSLFTLISSYDRAKKGEIMSWDEAAGTRSFALSTNRGRLWLAAGLYIVLVMLLNAWGTAQNTH